MTLLREKKLKVELFVEDIERKRQGTNLLSFSSFRQSYTFSDASSFSQNN